MTIANQEKKYISLIFKIISEDLKLSTPDNLQQRDFENLSFQIEEKTGIILSVSTLKRISKNQFTRIPQKNTLNALAQFAGYKDWYNFKINNPIDEDSFNIQKSQKKPGESITRLTGKFVYIPLTVVALIVILIFIFNSLTVQSYSEAKFSSRKNVSEGVPNTVIFDYDISMYNFKEASIQQSWDSRRRAEIKKDEKYSTSVYYYPGYHQAKLIIDDQMVKEIPVYITTDGWLSLIRNPKNDVIPVYVNENCISNGRIYISPEVVSNHNIDLEANNHFTSFYYVNENVFGDSDNFIFETTIKNNTDEGALICQGCEISILNEYGRHFIQLCSPGCIGELQLKFGTDYISGETNDLSAFGTDLNEWNKIRMEIKNKLVAIFMNEKEILRTSYEHSNGKIKGLYYNFAGSGAVDFARLYDAENNLVFNEDF